MVYSILSIHPIYGDFWDVLYFISFTTLSILQYLSRFPIIVINVNPGLINHGLLIRGYSPNSHDLIYINGTFPIKWPFGFY